ncbi:MAG: hypothetical protein NTU51_09290 [Bacteroidetes bacterium]|nr:hypothetical protein [Bacteroidota bacterium]
MMTLTKSWFLLIGLCLLFLTSCLPEQKFAQTFVKSGPKIRLMVTPPENIYKYNHKGEEIDGFEEMTDKQQDSALFFSSRFIQRVSDSAVLEDYVNQFISELRKAKFEVYLPDQMDSFLTDKSQAYMLNISQIQLDEYTYPLEDKEPVNDTVYYKKFNLNAMDFSVWFELSKVNATKPKKTVLYDSQSAFDSFDGNFLVDPWTNSVRYKYHIDTLGLTDVYDMARYLGKRHGEYLFDFFMNQWVAFNMPQNQYSMYYYHYNRKRNMMEATDEDRFQLLNDK